MMNPCTDVRGIQTQPEPPMRLTSSPTLKVHVALYHVEELVGRFVVVKRRLSAGRAMSLYQGQDT